MLLQRDLPQRLSDAFKQLLVFLADEQVEVGGEVAVEWLQAQAAVEMASNQRAQRGFQANRHVGQAGLNCRQCCVPIRQVLQPDLRMMRAQPAGVGPAFNDGHHPAVELAYLPWQPFTGAPCQQGGATPEAAGRGEVGAGQLLVSRAAKHHDQVGLVMTYSED